MIIDNQHTENVAFNSAKTNGLGLDGCMSDILKLFALIVQTGQEGHRNTIDALLDKIGDELISLTDMSFYKGVPGIGWGIEMIAQNKLMEIDTNDVLEELDDEIYKYVFSERTACLGVKDGILGPFLYFLARKHAIGSLHHYKAIINEECFSFIIDEIERLLNNKDGLFQKTILSHTELKDLSHCLYFFGDFYEERVNQDTSEKILYTTVNFVDNYLSTQTATTEADTHHQTLLALCYYIAGVKHKHNYWKKRAKSFLTNLPSPSSKPTTAIESLNIVLSRIYINNKVKPRIIDNVHSNIDALIVQLATSEKPIAKLYEHYLLLIG